MPSRTNSRTNSRASNRAASNARNEILEMLKEDHRRVKKAYREFNKLDADEDPERCDALVRQVLAEVEVHAALEEELLYPAARDAISDPDLVDEAEVEHESAHALINQLKEMQVDDEKFAARFTVLCEYLLHHIKEEEGELFPQLQSARLDWESLAREMSERRSELSPAEAGAESAGDDAGDDDSDDGREGAGEGGAAGRARGKSAGSRARGETSEGMAGEPGNGLSSRRV